MGWWNLFSWVRRPTPPERLPYVGIVTDTAVLPEKWWTVLDAMQESGMGYHVVTATIQLTHGIVRVGNLVVLNSTEVPNWPGVLDINAIIDITRE